MPGLTGARATTWVKPASASGDYWHTSRTLILDSRGRTVRIAAVTWYGMDSAYWVPAGLDFQRYTTIMDEVRLLGYNTIRLPFSNELVERNPVVRDAVGANPQFRNRPAMEVMDAIVRYAHRVGLKIILDNHRSRAARPLDVNILNEPLWYTRAFPEASWIRDWQMLARRYRHNDAVIGFDLRNEPHTAGSGPWTLHAYLRQGATWGPYRGIENRATDWRAAAQRAGNAVLAINPHLLIVVEGLQLYPDRTQAGGVVSSWWSGILTPVRQYPVILSVPHRLVYSPHDWGPHKWLMPWFQHVTDASLQRAWHRYWSFILDYPEAPYAAPILLGEFGTCTSNPRCINPPGAQGTWFQALLRFLRTHPAVGWSFFSLNGTNSNNCLADNGLLNGQWNNVSNRALQASLASTGAGPLAPRANPAPNTPLVPGTRAKTRPRSPHARLCTLP